MTRYVLNETLRRLKACRWWRRALTVTAFAVCCTPVSLWARAGGGGSFGSGGGGGGGGGGGDGIGVLIYVLIRLVFTHPIIGIPLLIVVVIVMAKSGKSGYSGHVSRTIRRGTSLRADSAMAGGLQQLQQRDPAFSPDAFTQRCATAFPKIQTAWAQQDMKPVRHFVSDGIYERFSLQIEMQRSSQLRNAVSDVQVQSARLVGVHSDAFFDSADVLITASAVDYVEDTKSGKRVHGSSATESFTEVWSFLRRPGARTLSQPGLLEGFCPNCGTPLQLADAVRCTSCQAWINSGEYDWVLAEITQTSEWRPRQSHPIPGVAEMASRDPSFNPQHLEDKGSVIFWHLRAAEFFARDAYIRKVALADYLDTKAAQFRPDEDGRHTFYADAAVGGVELTAVEPASGDDAYDRAHVHIRWSGHRETLPVPSLIRPALEKSRFHTNDLVLVRHKDARTSEKNLLSSAHCPGCGAPQTQSVSAECAYCGMPQNDGSSGWALERVDTAFALRPAAVTAAQAKSTDGEPPVLLSAADNERLVECAAAVMLADGAIDPREQEALAKMAQRRGISSERLAMLVSNVQQHGEVKAVENGQGPQNREFLRALIVMCLADGNVSRSERALIKGLVQHMQYGDVDIDMMITEERAQLYKESKQLIRKAN